MRNEQERNLLILKAIGVALALLLLPVGMALYLGWDIPPHGMREYYTSATGYAAPPKKVAAPVGTVPRGALNLVGPAEEHPEQGNTNRRRLPGESSRSETAPVPREGQQAPAGGQPARPESALGEREHAAAPKASARLRNPLAPTPEIIALGKRAYATNCAMCHGEPGQGVGPVGELYTPRPPNLATHVPAHSAGELYSVITDGIRSTPTPEAARYLPREWHAFRGRTSAKERWAIVAYLEEALGARRRAR